MMRVERYDRRAYAQTAECAQAARHAAERRCARRRWCTECHQRGDKVQAKKRKKQAAVRMRDARGEVHARRGRRSAKDAMRAARWRARCVVAATAPDVHRPGVASRTIDVPRVTTTTDVTSRNTDGTYDAAQQGGSAQKLNHVTNDDAITRQVLIHVRRCSSVSTPPRDAPLMSFFILTRPAMRGVKRGLQAIFTRGAHAAQMVAARSPNAIVVIACRTSRTVAAIQPECAKTYRCAEAKEECLAQQMARRRMSICAR